VVLQWSSPSSGGAPTTYVIEARSFAGGGEVSRYITGNVDTALTATGVATGTYYVSVRGVNATGTGEASSEVLVSVGDAAAPASGVPGPPSGLAGAVTGSGLTLSWSSPVTGGRPRGYRIEAGSSSGLSNLSNLATGTTATTFSASGIPAGTYYLRVRAENDAGTGAASNEIAVIVGGSATCQAPPGSPAALRSAVNASAVTLAWDAASGATSYVIEVGSHSGATDLLISDTGHTSTSFTARGVAGGTYFVRVRARNACGTGDRSNEVVVNIP
jgi:predicted phage tail protein